MTDKRPQWSRESKSPSLHKTQADSDETRTRDFNLGNKVRGSVFKPVSGTTRFAYFQIFRLGLHSP